MSREPGWAIRELEARVDVPEEPTPAPSTASLVVLLGIVAPALANLWYLLFRSAL